MKIAFVGKGGSGKTTLSASFSAYAEHEGKNLIVIDADLNMHLAELLGFPVLPVEQHISHPKASEVIRAHLKGENPRIQLTAHFRKTTPPGAGSRLLSITEDNVVFEQYTVRRGSTRFMVVGTYNDDGIGSSCYHNNLAVLENILAHMTDDDGIVVADMVAGTDAFASSLHAQFDMLVLVVEPTRRSLEVYDQYQALAEEAGVSQLLMVVGNKVKTDEDRAFIQQRVPQNQLIGFFGESEYLEEHDRRGGRLEIEKLESENKKLLGEIMAQAGARRVDPNERLKRLHDLHVRYVSQDSVRERFGDLRDQIDPNFSYRQA